MGIVTLVVIVTVAIYCGLFQRAKMRRVEMGGYNVRAGKVVFHLYKDDYT